MDYASSATSGSANPGAIHYLGVSVKQKLEESRKKVADVLRSSPDEIIFTSGATESNNLAILGLIEAYQGKSIPHIVTTNIEHPSVLEVCKFLERKGRARVSYAKVDVNGIVSLAEIKKNIKPNTILVSVMYANNEIGTIQPISEIAKLIRFLNKTRSQKIVFHSDANQAVNYLTLNTQKLGLDMMSFNSGKIYGPRGVGVLYIRRGVSVSPIMHGGNQEHGLRPGTENEVLSESLAKALEEVEKNKNKESIRLTKLRDYFLRKITDLGDDVVINGDLEKRLPNNVNITIKNIPSDLLVIELSARGICVASKSACKSGDGKASYVIMAINPKLKEEDGSVRFSLGRTTTKTEIDFTVKSLKSILDKLKKWYT